MGKHNKKDPFATREAEKYDNPIPSREFIMQYLEQIEKPVMRDVIAKHFSLTSDEHLEALRRRLRAMERDKQVIFTRKKGFSLLSSKEILQGKVFAHADGFGFLAPEDGTDDLFLSYAEMRNIFHGDIVKAIVVGKDHRGKREGKITEIMERAYTLIVGRFKQKGEFAWVEPESKQINQQIIVPAEQQIEGLDNDAIVEVEILSYPQHNQPASGKIIKVLGQYMDAGVEIEIAVSNHHIPVDWPLAVEKESKQFSNKVPEYRKKAREDYRQHPFVTIDGEDARDFDDAVCCEKSSRGWRLWVAIADVSSYVKISSALDEEARTRGTSVYFPNRVIPMLPEVLSNGLCSLNPEVDRLCMVCEMQVDKRGNIIDYRFSKGVMRSHARLSYTQVAAMLKKGKTLFQEYASIYPYLQELHALFKAFHTAREKRGAIDFETTETQIIFSDNKKIEKIVPTERNVAHQIIEECMLAANVCTANFLLQHNIPILYRNHEKPGIEKFNDLRRYMQELGLKFKSKAPVAKEYAQFLDSVKGRNDYYLLQIMLLRSLSQAVYAADNVGHFGLSYDAYTHFTSPIRRYPDLLVHRAIKFVLSEKDRKEYHYSQAMMQELGDHCSMTERRADDATREVTSWLKCEYMLDKVGENFTGIISGVTHFGLFVILDDIYVEGLIHISNIGTDYYIYDEKRHLLYAEHSGKKFRLGEKITIKVAQVNLEDFKIDFVPVSEATVNIEKLTGRKKRSASKKYKRK